MNKEHFFTSRSANNIKTFFLMALFLVGIIFFGFLISAVTGNVNYLWGAIFGSLIMNFVSYFFSKKIALTTSGAVEADENKYQELHQIVENLSQKAHIPKPDVYVINDPGPNAFATGRNQDNAAIAVTTGLLAMMNKNELEGVIAHELSHIKHKDILIMTVVVVLAGALSMLAHLTMQRSLFGSNDRDNGAIGVVIGLLAAIVLPVAATIVQLSISRKREFMADAGGALVTGYPDGLASALRKISTYKQPLHHATAATAHLYISCPFGGVERQSFFQKLFMTHPPVEERIKALIGDKELN
jgi:heat shock protein HtpX